MLYLFIVIVFIILQLRLIFTYITASTYNLVLNNRKKTPGPKPLVTVLIPAWNEEVGLEKTVLSVIESDYKNLEIYIIDDGSKDNTLSIARKIARRKNNGRFVRVFHQKNGGKFTALNNGIINSKSNIIVTIDADSYIYPDAISKLVEGLRHGADVSIGQICVGNRDKLVGRMQYFEYLIGFYHKQYQHLTNSISIYSGAFAAFKRHVYKQSGLYTGDAAVEDIEHSVRTRKHDLRPVYINDALCVTEGPSDFKGLLNQRIRWKHGLIQTVMMHRELLFKKVSRRTIVFNFFELPYMAESVIELMISPFFWGITIALILYVQSWYLMFWLFLVWPILTLLTAVNSKHFDKKMIIFLPFAGLMYYLLNFIECISAYIASIRVMRGVQTSWTVWKRVGV